MLRRGCLGAARPLGHLSLVEVGKQDIPRKWGFWRLVELEGPPLDAPGHTGEVLLAPSLPSGQGRSPSFLGRSMPRLAQGVGGALHLQSLGFFGFCDSS